MAFFDAHNFGASSFVAAVGASAPAISTVQKDPMTQPEPQTSPIPAEAHGPEVGQTRGLRGARGPIAIIDTYCGAGLEYLCRYDNGEELWHDAKVVFAISDYLRGPKDTDAAVAHAHRVDRAVREFAHGDKALRRDIARAVLIDASATPNQAPVSYRDMADGLKLIAAYVTLSLEAFEPQDPALANVVDAYSRAVQAVPNDSFTWPAAEDIAVLRAFVALPASRYPFHTAPYALRMDVAWTLVKLRAYGAIEYSDIEHEIVAGGETKPPSSQNVARAALKATFGAPVETKADATRPGYPIHGGTPSREDHGRFIAATIEEGRVERAAARAERTLSASDKVALGEALALLVKNGWTCVPSSEIKNADESSTSQAAIAYDRANPPTDDHVEAIFTPDSFVISLPKLTKAFDGGRVLSMDLDTTALDRDALAQDYLSMKGAVVSAHPVDLARGAYEFADEMIRQSANVPAKVKAIPSSNAPKAALAQGAWLVESDQRRALARQIGDLYLNRGWRGEGTLPDPVRHRLNWFLDLDANGSHRVTVVGGNHLESGVGASIDEAMRAIVDTIQRLHPLPITNLS